MRTFRYLFYRLYQLMISAGNKDVPEIAALFLMAMTLSLNFYSIISISYLFGYKIDLGLDSNFQIGLFFLILSSTLYFSFVYKKKYLEIANNYKMESDKAKSTGKLVAISYIISSFLLLFFFVYLMILKNRGEL